MREVSRKILHRYDPASHYLVKFKKDIIVNGSFCDVPPETLCHLFWHRDQKAVEGLEQIYY